jgi:short-subunit dehydrogenase
MKILVAGNPDYGLAKCIAQKYPQADFISRSHGDWDLSYYGKQRKAAELSLEYDVFISVSALWKHHQTCLVQEVAKSWCDQGHKGYMIVVGSTADTPVKGTPWMYPAEKKGLRAYCRQLSLMCTGRDNPDIKVTYLSPGNIHTPKQDEKMPDTPKLDPAYIASVIQWLLDQPRDINISELCLDKKENH